MLADPAISQLLSNPQLLAVLPQLLISLNSLVSLQASLNPNAYPAVAPQKNDLMRNLEEEEKQRNEAKIKKEKEEEKQRNEDKIKKEKEEEAKAKKREAKRKKKEEKKKKKEEEEKKQQFEKEEKDARSAAKGATIYVDEYMTLWHMGFKPHDAIIKALHSTRGNVRDAVDYLTH